jgi:hypothetical protein
VYVRPSLLGQSAVATSSGLLGINGHIAVGLGESDSVLLGIEELALIVPFHGVDDVKEVSIEPDTEVPEVDECVVLVPFQPTNEVDGTPEADEVERVPLYELEVEVKSPELPGSEELVLDVPFQLADEVERVPLYELEVEVKSPVLPGSEELELIVPFQLADEEERVPLYELDIEVKIPVVLVSEEFVLAVPLKRADEVEDVPLEELNVEVLASDDPVVVIPSDAVLEDEREVPVR